MPLTQEADLDIETSGENKSDSGFPKIGYMIAGGVYIEAFIPDRDALHRLMDRSGNSMMQAFDVAPCSRSSYERH